MKTRDETVRDLADQSKDQCEDLLDKMEAIISDFAYRGGVRDEEALCGITRDREGRSMLSFAEPGTTGQRTVVYVDAILALAKLLDGEV